MLLNLMKIFIYSSETTKEILGYVIVDKILENDIDSLFRSGGTTMLKNDIGGLDDFELISFMVVV